MAQEYVLGVDGGNTKTVALIGDRAGRVVGRGAGGCSDTYGAVSIEAAMSELDLALQRACESAGISRGELLASTLCLAGADWPEDFGYLAAQLGHLGLEGDIRIFNDAFGPLRAGTVDFVGVSVVCGTGAATGARAGDGRLWHTSWWQEAHGARHLGQKAIRAAARAELGIGRLTSMTERLLESYDAVNFESLLHRMTARGNPPVSTEAAARVLIAEAEAGDPVAVEVVQAHGTDLGRFAVAASWRVGLRGQNFPLVLAGSVMAGSCVLRRAVEESVQRDEPGAQAVVPALSPAHGALLLSYDRWGETPNTSVWMS